MRKIYALLLFNLITLFSFSQLNGTYTIGGAAPDYGTIQSAINDLVTNGVNGPTTFLIRDGNYSGQLNFGIIPGVDSTNRVTFQSENQDSSLVDISYTAAGFSDNWVLRLDTTQYITLKWLTLRSSGAGTYTTVIHINDQSHYAQVLNCRLESNLSSSSALVYAPQGSFSEHVEIRNNHFFQGGNGINFRNDGNTSFPNGQGTIVDNNLFEDNRSRAITMINHDFFEVTNNRVITPSQNNPNGFDAFYFSNTDKGGLIANNHIVVAGGSGIELNNQKVTLATMGNLYNNFISVTGDNPVGLHLRGPFSSARTSNWNVHNNTVIVNPNNTGFAFYLNHADDNNIYNNIFYNHGLGVALYNFNASIVSGNVMDHNVLYSADTTQNMWDGVNHLSLASFQNASSSNPNSLEVDPMFDSINDYHLCNATIDGAGTNILYSTSDMDGDLRDTSNPDIGLDEFNSTIDTTVNISGSMLTANQNGASYQWIDCGNGDTLIPGETSQSFTATQNGDYAVIITQGACVDTSNCTNVMPVGLSDNKFRSDISVFPNPGKDMITINFGDNQLGSSLLILDITGKEVYSGRNEESNILNVDICHLKNGVYFLKIIDENKQEIIKLMKQ